MSLKEHIFYRLFRWFPPLEEASRRASTRIYDEDLDARFTKIDMGTPPPITQRSALSFNDDMDDYDGV